MMTRRHVVLPAIILAALSACSADGPTGTPPGSADLTDPAVVSAEVATLDSAFAAPVTQAYLALAPVMSVASGFAPGSTAPSTVFRSTVCAAPFAPVAPPTPVSAGVATTFPDSILRHVFTWDSASASYQLTPDLSGPLGGIRFLIYRVSTFSQIVFPLSPIGHLDLIDESGAGPLTLDALVTDGAGNGADYTIAPSGTYSAYTVALSGSVRNGPFFATFNDTTGLAGATLTVAASVDVPDADAHVSLHASRAVADPFDNYYTLRFALRHGQETVGLDGTINTYCAIRTTNLTVTVNTRAFARVTDDAQGQVVTRVDGQPSGAAQTQAIMDLLELQRSLFQGFITLFAPARPLLPS
jgi:hypothetical protein